MVHLFGRKLFKRRSWTWLNGTILALLLLIVVSGVALNSDRVVTHAAGTIIYVKEGGSGNGSSWGSAYGTLQEALDAATSGDQIWVAKGTYYPTKERTPGATRSKSISLIDGVAIYGGFAGNEPVSYDVSQRDFEANKTILSGDLNQNGTHDLNDASSVIYNDQINPVGETVILDGVTITGSIREGVYLSHSSPTIRNVVITDNISSSAAAGVRIGKNSNPTFENVKIYNNRYNDNIRPLSGGAGLFTFSPVNLINVEIYDNQGIEYGGAYLNASSTLNNVKIYNNTVQSSHGIAGLYIEDDEGGSLTNVVIRNNTCDKCSADISQGISMKMAENITLTNVLIHDNHPGVSLHLEGSSVRLINSTISGKTGSSLINVIRGRYGINPYVPSRLEISNSILWGNSPSPFNIQDESTVEVRNSIIQGSGGSDAWQSGYGSDLGGNLDIDPKFVNPGMGDYQLQANSPAINQGDSSYISSPTDLAGNPRKVGTVDMGAYEVTANVIIDVAKSTLQVGYAEGDAAGSVTKDVTLPTSGFGDTSISWTSTHSDVIDPNTGKITRPFSTSTDASVTLTATISIAGVSDEKTFILTVKKLEVPSPTRSSIEIRGSPQVVVGQSGMIKVRLIDSNGNPIEGSTVSLSGYLDGEPFSELTITPTSGTSDAQGEISFLVNTTRAVQVTFTAEADGVTITDTDAKITFIPDVPDEDNSTIEADPVQLVADGNTSAEITVTVRDIHGNPIPDELVVLSDNTSNSTINPEQTTTNADGIAHFNVTNTKAEQTTFAATIDRVTITDTVTVTFEAGDVHENNSTLVIHGSTTATAGDSRTITVTILDANYNPIENKSVTLIGESNGEPSGDYLTIIPNTAVTDSQGEVTFTVSSTLATTITLTAEADGVTIAQSEAITFVPGEVSATISKVEAHPSTVVADGSSTAEIRVTVLDQYNNPISGKTVELKDHTTNSTITPVQATTDTNGLAIFTVSNTKAEETTYTAKVDHVTITDTAIVDFVAGDVHGSKSLLTADRHVVRADGIATATITVTVNDPHGNPVADREVELIQTGTSTITQLNGKTNATGKAQFTVANTTPETSSYQARDVATSSLLGSSIDVTFAGILISQTEMTLIEGGPAGEYQVSLNSAPVDTVTIQVYGGDTLNLSASELSFTQDNWQSPQSMSIRVSEGWQLSGSEQITVSQAVYSHDPLFNGLAIPSIQVTIINAEVTDLSLNPAIVQLKMGKQTTHQLEVEGTLSNGQIANVTGSNTGTIYTSSNPQVATVTAEGLIEAVRAGQATITIMNNGIVKTVDVHVARRDSRDSNTGTSPDSSETPTLAPPSQEVRVDMLINGKAVPAGIVTTTHVNNQVITLVTVDPVILAKELEEDGNADLSIRLPSDIDVGRVELNNQVFNLLATKQAIVEISTDQATYTLPVQRINLDVLLSQLEPDVDLEEINIYIEIARLTAEQVQIVENVASEEGFTLVTPPLSFSVKAVHEETEVEIANFNTYVERKIVIPDDFDPTQVATAIVINPDRSVRHVPTKIIEIDGQYLAVINSLTNSSYTLIWNPIEFQDVTDHWAKQEVNEMGSRLIIKGVNKNKFNPDQDITRAEFAAIIVRALGLKLEQGASSFSDVQSSDWYSGVVQTAYKYNLIAGFQDGTFRPNDKITREQAMMIISNAMTLTGLQATLLSKKTEQVLSPYVDSANLSTWSRNSVANSLQAGIVFGRSNTLLAPRDYIKRAEVAVIIYRLLIQSDLI